VHDSPESCKNNQQPIEDMQAREYTSEDFLNFVVLLKSIEIGGMGERSHKNHSFIRAIFTDSTIRKVFEFCEICAMT